jgi:DNA-binding MarR family transcriptional regulator
LPLGICIINWNPDEGGSIGVRHPQTLEVPDNIVQILQISHNFTPGLLHIKESNFNALSFGNEALQKVIVLVLSIYEDSEDFKGIIEQINQVVNENPEDDNRLLEELKRVFELSQTVFKAREAVMMKLAQEIADLKNREVDLKNSLRYLFMHEKSARLRFIYILMLNGPMTETELTKELKVTAIILKRLLNTLEKEKIIEKVADKYNLLLYFQD